MKILRYIGEDVCKDERYTTALDDESVGVVDSLTGDRNVTVRFRLNGQPMRIEPDDETRDFVDLAVAVYIADELVKRETSADRWTRDFELIVPVLNQTFKLVDHRDNQVLGFLMNKMGVYVVLKDVKTVHERELIDLSKDQMTGYKYPVSFVVEEIRPMSANKKNF